MTPNAMKGGTGATSSAGKSIGQVLTQAATQVAALKPDSSPPQELPESGVGMPALTASNMGPAIALA